MKKKMTRIFFLILFLGFGSNLFARKFWVVSGVLDLQDWNPQRDGAVELTGDWEFYPGQLLTPQEIRRSEMKPDLMFVCGSWTKKYPKLKYATYRLQIRNLKPGVFALKLYDIGHAYTLWINGRKILSNGKVATRKEDFQNNYQVRFSYGIVPDMGEVEIVIQVANFSGWRAGIWKSLIFGTEAQINRGNFLHFMLDLVAFGFLLALGFYHIFLIFTQEREMSVFLLGLTALLFSIRLFPEGERSIYYLFPDISGDTLMRLAYFGYYGTAFLFPSFVASFFKEENHPLLLIHRVLCLPFLVSLLFPMRVFTYFLPSFHVLTLFGMIGIFLILIRSIRLKKKDAWLILFIIIFFFLTGLNDILNSLEIIQTTFISYYGFTFVLLAQGWVLANRFSRAFKENEILRHENYRAFLKEKELNELKTQFLSTASHEFKTPLAVIQSSVDLFYRHWNDMDVSQRERYFNQIHGAIERITDMMNDVLYLSRAENKDWMPIFSKTDLVLICENAIKEIRLSAGKSEREIFMTVKGEAKPCFLDPSMVRLILDNLVSNAVKYSGEKCRVELLLDYKEKGVEIHVKDQGIGMDSRTQSLVFQRFYRAENVRNHIPGTGLGLAIVKKTLEKMGGNIRVSSRVNRGSDFTVIFEDCFYEKGKEESVK